MQVVPLILKDLKGLLDFFFVKQDHVFMGFAFSYLGFLSGLPSVSIKMRFHKKWWNNF